MNDRQKAGAETEIAIERGSNNVFADLGFEDAEAMQLKAGRCP